MPDQSPVRRHLPVLVPSIQNPIQESPGFAKKGLADYKLDLCGLCAFGCRYCSSNHGNYLRIRREEFRQLTIEQLGIDAVPATEPRLTFLWPDVLEKLEQQLGEKDKSWGAGKTLVVSMLTDGFSPPLVADGTTKRALEMVLDGTSFRIRILTKNAVVGKAEWVDFFARSADRFVVGLSTGTLDDGWARRVEIGTSSPSARLRALRALQAAGVPTFGMLCPVFPDVLLGGSLHRLVEEVRPETVETIWAEPFNDRTNWRVVRNGYHPQSVAYDWFERAFGPGTSDVWSRYATDLYLELRKLAERDGWLTKLVYLLYKARLAARDAADLGDLSSVRLQSPKCQDGLSRNAYVARVQRRAGR